MNKSPGNLRDSAILSVLLDSYWAMEPKILGRMADVIFRHAAGVKLPEAEIAAIVAGRSQPGAAVPGLTAESKMFQRVGNVAVVPICGILVKHSHMVNGESQPRGTSTLDLQERLAAAVDSDAESILLLADSPGGSVFGINDAADLIAMAAQQKPVVAMAEDLAASGAYWLISQASRIYANATALVGSIGVYTLLMDSSREYEKSGYKMHLVKAGEFKGIGADGVAIDDTQLAVVQAEINSLYELFIGAVARGRGMNADQARTLADGRIHVGMEAMDNGLIDGITTTGGLLEYMNQGLLPGGQKLQRTGGGLAIAATNYKLKEQTMEKQLKTEPAAVETAPDAAAIQAAANKTANEAAAQRVKDLAAVLGNRPEMLAAAIADGLSVVEAKARLADTLTGENAALVADIKTARGEMETAKAELAGFKKLAADAGLKEPLKIAGKDTAEGGSATGGGATDGYEADVQARVAAGAKEHRARIEASKKFPDGHKAWLGTQKR